MGQLWAKLKIFDTFRNRKDTIMATVNFSVRSSVKGRLCPIYLRLKDGKGVDIRVTTRYKVYPEYWSNETQSVKQRIVHMDIFTLDDKANLTENLVDLRSLVLKEYNQRVAQTKSITREWLHSTINREDNSRESITLNDYIEEFIRKIESGEQLYNHNNRTERYKSGTIRNYKGFKEQFNLFQQDLKKQLDFDDITIDVYDRMIVYFNNKKYSPNTIGRHVKNLKAIMRTARDQGLHSNMEIERKRFKSIKVPVQEIYLTEDELQKMFDLDLSDRRELEIARDVFLVGCYTAQRYSDYSRINSSHIRDLGDGVKVIDLIQKKTGEQVLIPMRAELIQILEKYGYNLPRTFEQKVNSRIKDVGALAGITAIINKEEVRGGLKVLRKVPKNELIKTHTARRSGCTNMYLGHVNHIDIMKISGHKTEREFLAYIKVSKEQTAQRLNTHPYFTKLMVG